MSSTTAINCVHDAAIAAEDVVVANSGTTEGSPAFANDGLTLVK